MLLLVHIMRKREWMLPGSYSGMETAMKLDQLLERAHIFDQTKELPAFKAIRIDSRKVEPGDLFVCIRGRREDGHRYIPEALQRGAVALILDSKKYREQYDAQTTVIYVPDTRKILPVLAACYFEYPARETELIGVTGTNGKTTVTTIAHETFQNLGFHPALIGTIQNYAGEEKIDIETTTDTTPDCLELHEILQYCCRKKANPVWMEVSSIGLKNHRCDRLDFEIGVFLNLSKEHMEDHGTMADYFASKCRLFSMVKRAVINSDDAYGEKLIQKCEAQSLPVFTFGMWKRERADLSAENVAYTAEGLTFDAVYQQSRVSVRLSVPCEFEIYNVLAVLSVCILKGFSLEEAVKALPEKIHVSGRYEMIRKQDTPAVIIDYAHTPDALEKLLFSIRKSGQYQKIFTVFGCGGDRDPSKRSTMGRISQQLSDYTVLTSDNPRTEEPHQIIRDIEGGMIKERNNFISLSDRADAIRYALHQAQPQDVVVIAGKGHETYQVIGDEKLYFSDKETVLRYLV